MANSKIPQRASLIEGINTLTASNCTINWEKHLSVNGQNCGYLVRFTTSDTNPAWTILFSLPSNVMTMPDNYYLSDTAGETNFQRHKNRNIQNRNSLPAGTYVIYIPY